MMEEAKRVGGFSTTLKKDLGIAVKMGWRSAEPPKVNHAAKEDTEPSGLEEELVGVHAKALPTCQSSSSS